VAGDAALLVEPTDTNALSAAIARLLQDAELRQRLVSKGQDRRRQFSFQRMAKEFLELYHQITDENGG